MTVKRRLRILISNDDGYHAPGIRCLANQLAELGHEVFVGAPDRERSTTGHCLTLHKPLRAEEVTELYSPHVAKAWMINGTPCDAAKLAMNMLLDINTLDVIVSGINRGPNLGTDVIYSGTVSAAVEGAIRAIPAIAVSLDSFDDLHYETAARYVGEALEQIHWEAFPRHMILNINVPAVAYEQLAGVRVTKLGLHRFRDVFEKREDLRGKTYYWQTGVVENREESPDSDVFAVREGYVSVTPIHYDMTRYDFIGSLQEWSLRLT
ncbi:MAG: 5'/3'-nucleotidase SurE [Candidatus Melainabacteria bacterium HGW-Melainabacteria-1]|nr:MAG: 5'/3'-nucleotidase SurE [Candidatus Melainabacteria bacterium HGW-Melainabacteria-1]